MVGANRPTTWKNMRRRFSICVDILIPGRIILLHNVFMCMYIYIYMRKGIGMHRVCKCRVPPWAKMDARRTCTACSVQLPCRLQQLRRLNAVRRFARRRCVGFAEDSPVVRRVPGLALVGRPFALPSVAIIGRSIKGAVLKTCFEGRMRTRKTITKKWMG